MLHNMKTWRRRASDRIDQIRNRGMYGYKTDLVAVDEQLRIIPGKITIIGARPGHGKTSFGLHISRAIGRQFIDDSVVAIFSAEMSGEDLMLRLACEQASVSMRDVVFGKATDEQLDDVELELASLEAEPFYISDESRPTTSDMFDRVSRMNEVIPVGAILFDYIELVGNDNTKSEELRLSQAYDQLLQIAKTFNVPVIILAQLNRTLENIADRWPSEEFLRYSGKAEQVAEAIILLMRPEYYLDKGTIIQDTTGQPIDEMHRDASGVMYVVVAKNRTGGPFVARVGFDKKRMTFHNL